jgi:TonB family protein
MDMNQKIRIMKRPQVPDDEIENLMDFESVLQNRNRIIQNRNSLLKTGLVVSGLTVLTIVYFYSSYYKHHNAADQMNGTELPLVPIPSEEAHIPSQEHEVNSLNENLSYKETPDHPEKAESGKKKNEPNLKKGNDEKSVSENKKPDNTDEPLNENIYIQAEPVQGYDHLFAYFRENIKYPAAALKDSVEGVLTVSFVVASDGKPRHIQIEKTLGPDFEKEAIQLIEGMPAWKPATLNGKPVRSKVTLPLTFEIKTINH